MGRYGSRYSKMYRHVFRIERGRTVKLHSIGRLETELSKIEIQKRVKERTLTDISWKSLFNADEKDFMRGIFEEDVFSFFYISKGRGDMLMPKIIGKIVEKEDGCDIELFYSRTIETLIVYLWLLFFMCCVIFGCHNIFIAILGVLICFIFVRYDKNCNLKICKKVVDILERNLESINWSAVYNNPQIEGRKLEKIAERLTQKRNIDLMEYFDLQRCSSKFCWLNFLYILEKMPRSEWERGMPLLFQLLQDPNWPTYEKTVQLLEKIDKKILMPYIKEYLKQAYDEDDEMWIESIKILENKIIGD